MLATELDIKKKGKLYQLKYKNRRIRCFNSDNFVEHENLINPSQPTQIQLQDSEKKRLQPRRASDIINHSMSKGNSDEEMFTHDVREQESELSIAPPDANKNNEDYSSSINKSYIDPT